MAVLLLRTQVILDRGPSRMTSSLLIISALTLFPSKIPLYSTASEDFNNSFLGKHNSTHNTQGGMGQALDWVRAPCVGVKAFCPDANEDEPVGWEAPAAVGKGTGGCGIWVTQSE